MAPNNRLQWTGRERPSAEPKRWADRYSLNERDIQDEQAIRLPQLRP